MFILCDKCNSEFKECVTCSVLFHPFCKPSGSDNEPTVTEDKSQECHSCSAQRTSKVTAVILEALDSFETAVNLNIDAQLGSVRESVDSLREELRSVNSKLAQLEITQTDKLNNRCDKLEKLLEVVKEDLKKELKEVCHQVETVCNGNAEIFKTPERDSVFCLVPKRKFPEYV